MRSRLSSRETDSEIFSRRCKKAYKHPPFSSIPPSRRYTLIAILDQRTFSSLNADLFFNFVWIAS